MYSVLPSLVFVTLPSRPSSRFHPIAPRLSLFSVPPAFSALKSPCTLSCQLARRPIQPNHFPLFPHPVNIAHTPTPANPFRSIVSAHFPSPPGGGGYSQLALPPLPMGARFHSVPNSFKRNTYKKLGGGCQRSAWSAPLGSLPLYFVTSLPQFRYTISRHSP
jgi:hypothetical protein